MIIPNIWKVIKPRLVVDLPPWQLWVRQIGSSPQLLGKIKYGWWMTYPSGKIWKSMGRIIPYMTWKKMFETTNQTYFSWWMYGKIKFMFQSPPTRKKVDFPASHVWNLPASLGYNPASFLRTFEASDPVIEGSEPWGYSMIYPAKHGEN